MIGTFIRLCRIYIWINIGINIGIYSDIYRNITVILYHGSNVSVQDPKIIVSDRKLDFGPGFYLTSSYEQASRWSVLTVMRRKRGCKTISVFEFDE